MSEDFYHFGKDFGLVYELNVAMHQNLVPRKFSFDTLDEYTLSDGSIKCCVY